MKSVRKVNIKWRTRRICTKIAITSVITYLIALIIMILFSKVLDRQDVWLMSSTMASILFFFIVTCVYIGIAIKAKKTKMVVYCKEKRCRKGNKTLYYVGYQDRQTLWQRVFGLLTIEFWDENGKKIIFKDICDEVLNYL